MIKNFGCDEMKIDMHIHTEYSYDGISKIRKVFKKAKKKGLDGVAITDHFDIRGWKEAKEIAEEMNMFFIPGEEIKVLNKDKKIIAEVIAYFIKKGIGNKTIEELEREIHSQGGLIFLAHPFAKSRPAPRKPKELLRYVDGIETINARSRVWQINRRASRMARNMNMPVVGGSDAHIPEEVGYAYTEVKGAKNLKEFKEGLQKGDSIAKGKKTNFFFHYASQLKGRI
ncbi:MAG: PHP domain-containing protein, partial [archaeon]